MRGCGRALKALGRSDEMDTPERSKIGGTPLSKFEVISIRCPRREAFVDDFIPFCWVFFDSFFLWIWRERGGLALCGVFSIRWIGEICAIVGDQMVFLRMVCMTRLLFVFLPYFSGRSRFLLVFMGKDLVLGFDARVCNRM